MDKACDITVPLVRCIDGDDTLDFLYKQGEYAGSKLSSLGLIVLDLNLPGTDGREVLMQIKSDERLQTIPVVVFATS